MSTARQGLVSLVFGVLLAAGATSSRAESGSGVPWLHDDIAAFARAKAEHRYVILYLEAVWCHWCHVMDHETYSDPKVQATLAAHYVPLRIDQDNRPDLSERYSAYGWPATIVFAADGSEIVKRRGYLEKTRFLRLLDAIVADPSPEDVDEAAPAEAPAATSSLADEVRADLVRRHREMSDVELGGLKIEQKFLDRDEVGYAMAMALAGDADEARIARATLDGARALIDPAWGGVYQYSTDQDWKHPHFEKLGRLQAEYLATWANASLIFPDGGYRESAAAVKRYIDNFLSADDGGFYVSQDADLRPGEHSGEYFALDDAGRRKQGVPRVDRHEYSREAGLTIEGLVAWFDASGDAAALARARRAADWALAERALPGGGFRHDAKDPAGPYLSDTLAMGRAFLALYRSTGERVWLARSEQAADFIEKNFHGKRGYASAAVGKGPIAASAEIEQNVSLARYANALARSSGRAGDQAIARHALGLLGAPDIASLRSTDAGILLADLEINRDPLHLTVVGAKSDPAAAELFARCRSIAGLYKRLEWWDRAEGDLPNSDVQYPKLKKAAAFVCTEGRCSTPMFKPDDIDRFLAESR